MEKIEIYNCGNIAYNNEGELPYSDIRNNLSLNTLLLKSTPVICDILGLSIENVSFDFDEKESFGNPYTAEFDCSIRILGDYCDISKLSVDGASTLNLKCDELKIDEMSVANGVTVDLSCDELKIDEMLAANGVTVKAGGVEPKMTISRIDAYDTYFASEFWQCVANYGLDIEVFSAPYCQIGGDLILSKCVNLKTFDISGSRYGSFCIDVRGASNLQELDCNNSSVNNILFDEHINYVDFYCFYCYGLKQEFPAFYAPQADHRHDWRYGYTGSPDDFIYADNGYGWWYPCEPNSWPQERY